MRGGEGRVLRDSQRGLGLDEAPSVSAGKAEEPSSYPIPNFNSGAIRCVWILMQCGARLIFLLEWRRFEDAALAPWP